MIKTGDAVIGWSDASLFKPARSQYLTGVCTRCVCAFMYILRGSVCMCEGGSHLSWGFNGHHSAQFIHRGWRANVNRGWKEGDVIGFIASLTPAACVITLTINGAPLFTKEHDRAVAMGLTPAVSVGRGFVGVWNFGPLVFPPKHAYVTIAQAVAGVTASTRK